jgi:hypothetical protein
MLRLGSNCRQLLLWIGLAEVKLHYKANIHCGRHTMGA